jgi:hypothetical protein
MQNKFLSFFIIITLFFAVSSLENFVHCQTTSTSPFSSFGIGERDGLDHSTFCGLGNTEITYFDSTTLNYFNPSTYNTIAKGQPLFSVGVSSRLSFYKENGIENFSKAILLNHFAMGLSFSKHFGLAFGLKPFSRRGYEFQTKQLLGTDTIVHTYLGNGSTNEVFLGLSSNLLKLKNHQLSVGGNLGYVFGTLTNERRSNFVGSTSGGVDQKTLKLSTMHYELGLFYKHRINEKNSYTISSVFEPKQTFSAFQESYLFTSAIVDDPLKYYKLDSTGSIKGNVILPSTLSIGFNYTFSFNDIKKETQIRHSELSFHTSYKTSNWNEYRTNFSGIELNPNYSITNKLTIGIQYIPEKTFLGQTGSSSFIETIRYRAGYYQYSLPNVISGEMIKDKGLTVGFGLPIKIQRSLSSVNIGFSVGQRGVQSGQYLKENYFGINLGVVFAPANFERWFVKRKLD